HITTHNPVTFHPTFQSSLSAEWKSISGSKMGFQTIYCTSMSPPSLNNDLDLTLNTQLTPNVGLSIPGGTVSRVVDFAPGFETTQHRTQSLDLGVVIEGTVELVLDSGERRIMGAGDTIVQRGTRHAWRNASERDWARMFFVLMSCEPVEVGGNVLEEDHG
ncbi:hypothetical protein L207DRAFT_404313, partial [Hyaloscypha variabilis F]